MYRYKCLNQIAQTGLDQFTRDYVQVEEIEEADALLVRSAALHDMEFPKSLKAIARAGAGVNNIPLGKCAEEGIVVFNTPGANANGVKELVLAGLLLNGMREGRWHNLLFCGTGALLSTTSVQQGESIPSICHAAVISTSK